MNQQNTPAPQNQSLQSNLPSLLALSTYCNLEVKPNSWSASSFCQDIYSLDQLIKKLLQSHPLANGRYTIRLEVKAEIVESNLTTNEDVIELSGLKETAYSKANLN